VGESVPVCSLDTVLGRRVSTVVPACPTLATLSLCPV
jgi:hypothetical protein